jgi:HAMP domain-containing protein
MNSSNNLKSGQKTLSMQMLVLAVVIILVAFIGLLIQKSSMNDIFNSGFKDYQRSTKLLKDVYSVHESLYRIQSMVASGQDKQEIAKLSDQQATVINEDVNLVKKALESKITEEQKKYYQAIMNNLIEYQKLVLRIIKLAPMGTGGAYVSASNEKMEAITQLLSELLIFESKVGEKGYDTSNLAFYAVMVMLLILLVLSVLLVPSFIKKTMNSSVIEPLQETSGVLREYASGKYARSLAWDADDAIGELVQSVNALRSKMSSSSGPAPKSPTAEAPAPASTAAPVAAEESAKSLSGMIKKAPDQMKEADKLVTTSRKAIDKLQDI